MRITVLMDNYAKIDVYHLAEPGVSYWIEENGRSFLFDTGYSGAFLKNAIDMGIDITKVEAIILSHGHNDHTGGLSHLLQVDFPKKPTLICHPDCLQERMIEDLDIGCPVSKAALDKQFNILETAEPLWITERLAFLGGIPRKTVFEEPYSVGRMKRGEKEEEDFVLDDSALAYRGKDGVFLVTGCSHGGVCNMIEAAKAITGCCKVGGILGGFHLFDMDERSHATLDYLAAENIDELYPCHCTSFDVRAALAARASIGEVFVGLKLDWE